ncbi:MAG: amidohydrolase family protein [Gemmatimonadaceae bacterium]|nr:amidohydrolase family protein [Gemmatimonadaceae bacterium]
MARLGLPAMLLVAMTAPLHAQDRRVFDVHMHAGSRPASAAAMVDSLQVTKAVYIGTADDIAQVDTARYLRALMFPCGGGALPNVGTRCFADGREWPDTAWLRQAVKDGRVQVFGEIGAQYLGIAPDDVRLDPYYALAEELQVPVGVHLGIGPPGVAYGMGRRPSPAYDGFAGDPRSLEKILVRYPKLRLYVMHAAWPSLEAMLYMLYMHPQLYADVSVLQYAIPRPAYTSYLKALVDAGFSNRLMYGSDGGARFMKDGVRMIEEADFLTSTQKRALLYDNAARFFGR